MIPRRPRAGLVCWLVPVLMLAGGIRSVAAQEKGELLLVEHPTRLTVLNRYQQTLTNAERSVLQPFVPMVVVQRRDMLGDGFTPCMRVRINGAEYFLVRDGSGRLVGEAQAGIVSVHDGTLHGGDTVLVLRAGAVMFSSPDGRRTAVLGAGERLIRLLSRSERTYVRRGSASDPYGWVDLAPSAEGRLWGAARLAVALPSSVPPPIVDQVRSALSRANTKLANVFAFLATRGGVRRSVPRWEIQPEGAVLRCTLVGGSTVRDFPESTRYLMRDVQARITESGFRTVAVTDGFEVRPD